MSVLAFALGGVALMGIQPSGAYLAKELLLQAATETEQWWWAVVLQAGGIFTGAYVLLVLAHMLAPANEPIALAGPVPRIQEAAALALALCSLLLGLVPWEPYLAIPHGMPSNPFGPAALSKSLLTILGGAVMTILLGRPFANSMFWKALAVVVGPVRRASELLQRIDDILRDWPAAGISLLMLALLFGASMLMAL
jgi:NADH:ubiquinone oxidoreductase subunit 5 (subunit L)/multisubunit Na+/H+ antiporter MnhA subunit